MPENIGEVGRVGNRKFGPFGNAPLTVTSAGCPSEVFAGDLRGGFDEFFSTCVKNEAESAKHVEPTICYTPIRWIADGLQEVLGLSGGGYPRFQIQQLESLREDDVFRPSGSVSSFQQEFILMDVVLNRALTPVDLASAVRGGAVVPVRAAMCIVSTPRRMGSFEL
ncbi:hypothetical protein MHU86_22544 [Fragilaria crotonensis]|nr:hypothetical protein MHU86_22544 [Fragilaria crotonensis]